MNTLNKMIESQTYTSKDKNFIQNHLKQIIYNRKEVECYYVDDCGNVYSTKRNRFRKMKHAKDLSNYPILTIMVCGKKKTVRVHRLVAETFFPDRSVKEAYGFTDKQWKTLTKFTRHKIENTMTVNHIDGNTENFSPENLEWLSQEDNNNHYINKTYAKNEY
jgi:hypothetical protein